MSVKSTTQPQLLENPQREFACHCGRIYQSYAAVYTHIRNKHQRDQYYIDRIKRPSRQNHKKGRPKKTSKGFHNKEIEEIHIFESSLYKFIQSIQQGQAELNISSDILLQGDQSLDPSCIIKNYDKKYPLDFNILKSDNPNPIYTQIKRFYEKFVKHLNVQMSCKILWTLNKLLSYYGYMTLNQESLDISFKSIPQSILKEVWFGTVEPIRVIIDTFREFMKHSELEPKNQNDYIEEFLEMNEKQQCSSQINQFQIG